MPLRTRFKSYYKIFIAIFVVGLFMMQNSFAQSSLCPSDMTDQLTRGLNIILSLLSWVWIWLASFAGKLMTNGFIYGEFMNLDKILFYLWNLSRTFANFLLVGIILYEVVKTLVGQGDRSSIIKYVAKLAGGAILINLSRFLIGATVDVSTILTTTSAALSNTYIASETTNLKQTMVESIRLSRASYRQKINMSNKLCANQAIIKNDPINNEELNDTDANELFDTILPTETSISGPLLYLGIGVLELQNYQYNSNNPNAIIDNLFVVSTRLAVVIVFTMMMVLLVLINIFRLIAIRFAVAFGPLLIVLHITKQQKILESIGGKFNAENIFKAIFAPVVAVGLLSVSLIAIVMMQGLLQHTTHIERGESYMDSTEQGSRIGVEGVFDTTIAGDIFGRNDGQNVKNTFTNIFLIAFTILILFGVIKVLLSFLGEKGIGSTTYQNIRDLGQQALGALPLIPTKSGRVGASAAQSRINTSGPKRALSNLMSDQNTMVQNSINRKLGLPTQLLSRDLKGLQRFNENLNKKKTLTKDDYDLLVSESKSLLNKASYKGRSMSISQMQAIPESLELFLKNIANNQLDPSTIVSGASPSKLATRGNTTVEQFIKDNYQKNPTLFKIIYSDLGGDADMLFQDGSNFWSKPMKWKQ